MGGGGRVTGTPELDSCQRVRRRMCAYILVTFGHLGCQIVVWNGFCRRTDVRSPDCCCEGGVQFENGRISVVADKRISHRARGLIE